MRPNPSIERRAKGRCAPIGPPLMSNCPFGYRGPTLGAMTACVVRLGSPRRDGERGPIGTAGRPPRGIPKTEYSAKNWHDVWFPNLAASAKTMKLGQARLLALFGPPLISNVEPQRVA
jgi:hypothetical protein